MKALWIAAALLSLAGPALAQFAPTIPMGAEKEITPEQKARNRANEAAARAASSTIVPPKTSSDPWADVRAPQTPAKPVAKHKSAR